MLKDLHYAWRIHRRSPLFVCVVLASIALSIGANTLIVSILYALFLRPIPFFGDLDRLVLLSEQVVPGPWMAVSAREFRGWKDRQGVFASLAAFRNSEVNLAGDGEPERVKASSGSRDLFTTLGVQPLLGRGFGPNEFERGQNDVVIISHALWTKRFGGDRDAIGRTLRVDGEPHVLVGVTPPGFTFPDQKTHLWRPLVLAEGPDATNRDLQLIARLKPGVTLDQVRAEMSGIAVILAAEYPDTNRNVRFVVRPLRDEMVGNARPSLVVLTCAVIFLFLVACINVATLQYARNETRRAEIATRAALGATRARLLRQFLTESMLLALAGGALGVGLAYVGLDLLMASVYLDIPSYFRLAIDNNILAFATAASALTGVAFGIAPVMDLSRPTFLGALKESSPTATGSRRARRIYAGCAIVEVTLAFGLLAGSATAFKSLRLLQKVDPGFQVDERMAGQLALPESQYPGAADRLRFYDRVLAGLTAVAEVRDAALISRLPAGGSAEVRTFEIPEAGGWRSHSALYYACSPRLFEALGIRVVGRSFAHLNAQEASGAAIVSTDVARRLWKSDIEAIGKTLRLADRYYSIVGVAAEIRHFGLNRGNTPAVYVLYGPEVPPRMGLAIVSKRDSQALAPAIKAVVSALDADIPVADIRSLRTFVEESITVPRVVAMLLPFFAASALLMAFVGLFGVIAYSIAQREREVAIRRALGASDYDVGKIVLKQAAYVAGTGVLFGAVLSYVLVRLMVGFFHGIAAVSPLMLAAIAGGILGLSVVAACVPGFRAIRVEPTQRLRSE